MGSFEVRLTAPLAAAEAYDRILDLDAHTATIPFTTVRVTPEPGALTTGTRFLARTALGPVGIDDSMVVEEFTRPTGDRAGVCRIRKTGRWVRGTILLTVAPTDRTAPERTESDRTESDPESMHPQSMNPHSVNPHSAIVRWSQDIAIRGLSRVADPLVTLVASRAYRLVLRRLLADRPEND
ncbi:MAG TPA: hypothetical protein GXZ30_10565 [Propionibacterium sp.]|nr:hypothetical protein [Propionibacterium sp.]